MAGVREGDSPLVAHYAMNSGSGVVEVAVADLPF